MFLRSFLNRLADKDVIITPPPVHQTEFISSPFTSTGIEGPRTRQSPRRVDVFGSIRHSFEGHLCCCRTSLAFSFCKRPGVSGRWRLCVCVGGREMGGAASLLESSVKVIIFTRFYSSQPHTQNCCIFRKIESGRHFLKWNRMRFDATTTV